jgi:hypothetical protein
LGQRRIDKALDRDDNQTEVGEQTARHIAQCVRAIVAGSQKSTARASGRTSA